MPSTADIPVRSRWYPAELFLVAGAAILLNLAGAVLGKYIAVSLSHVYICLALFALLCGVYLLRTVYWVVVGRRWQLSFLYPVLSVSYLASLVLGMFLFKEPFMWNRLFGALVIVGGVLIISTSPHRHERRKP